MKRNLSRVSSIIVTAALAFASAAFNAAAQTPPEPPLPNMDRHMNDSLSAQLAALNLSIVRNVAAFNAQREAIEGLRAEVRALREKCGDRCEDPAKPVAKPPAQP